MDSTADDDVRRAKRARLTPDEDAVDLISGLEDDVLLRILGLVADARDVVRTGAVSRRWLGLSKRVPALCFTSPPECRGASRAEQCAILDRFVSFVNHVLARRTQSDGSSIESLDISCTVVSWCYKPPVVDAVQGWIRYAFQHGVKSFALDLSSCIVGPMVALDELPSPARLETIRLALNYRLQLPTTIKFASLTDLSLVRIKLAAGDVHLVTRLVSTESCPRLQKLRMADLHSPNNSHEEMFLESNVLSELWIEKVSVMVLQLKTPRLHVLNVDSCNHDMLRVSAPRLEQLALPFKIVAPSGILTCSPRCFEVDGDLLPCVRSLKICLWSYSPHNFLCTAEAVNDASRLLIKLCSSVTKIDVILCGRKVSNKEVDVLKSRIPHLPHVTSLTVDVSNKTNTVYPHDFGASVTNLLTRFSNLRRLSIHLPSYMDSKLGELLGLECDHPDHWISNEISLSQLLELEFTGLIGIDCELWLIKNMFASARGIHKVIIHFSPKCWQHQAKMDAFERMLLDAEGMWTSHRGTLKLTCLK